ncbi:unnamed protein product [Camellia sinensis]
MKRCVEFMKSNLPYICMILSNLVFAGTVLFSKVAIANGMNPYVFGAYRQAFATLALAPFAFFLERKNSAPLSFNLLCKIFLAAMSGITLCINLFNLSLNYIPATFVTATSNAIPAITFVLAILLRVESFSITQWHGVAMVLGSMLCVCGALLVTLVKGPPVHLTSTHKDNSNPTMGCRSKVDCIKGCLIIISAQTALSFWLVMQGLMLKIYPNKLRLTALQCFFSCIQTLVWAVAVDRNISAWKLRWDFNLLAVAYCWYNVQWGELLDENLGNTKEGTRLCSSIYSSFFYMHSHLLSINMEGDTPLGKDVGGFILLVCGLYGVLWGKHKEGKIKPSIEQKSETKEETV